MKLNRTVWKIVATAGAIALFGAAIFPTRTPDEIVALVGIPLTIYFLLPIFLVHLVPLPEARTSNEKPVRGRFARALSLIISTCVWVAYFGVIAALSAIAHRLIGASWGQEISTLVAFGLLAISVGTVLSILILLYVLQMVLKGLLLYRGWVLARKAVQASAESILGSVSRYARAA